MPSSLVPQELCTCSFLSRMLFPWPHLPGLCLNVTSPERPFLTFHSNTPKLYLHTPQNLASHSYPVFPFTPLIIIFDHILICYYLFIIYVPTSWKSCEGQNCLSLHSSWADPEKKIKYKLFRKLYKEGKAAKKGCYDTSYHGGNVPGVQYHKATLGNGVRLNVWGIGVGKGIYTPIPTSLIGWGLPLGYINRSSTLLGNKHSGLLESELWTPAAGSILRGIHHSLVKILFVWGTILFPAPIMGPLT